MRRAMQCGGIDGVNADGVLNRDKAQLGFCVGSISCTICTELTSLRLCRRVVPDCCDLASGNRV